MCAQGPSPAPCYPPMWGDPLRGRGWRGARQDAPPSPDARCPAAGDQLVSPRCQHPVLVPRGASGRRTCQRRGDATHWDARACGSMFAIWPTFATCPTTPPQVTSRLPRAQAQQARCAVGSATD